MRLKELSPASTTASPVETHSISWAFKCRRNTVLVLLVTQITLSALLMRYSRTHAPEGHRYRASVAVVMTEAMKLPIALLLAGCTLGSPRALMDLLRNELPTRSTLKCAVPAFAYTLQGNLLFVATANLETPTFQVTYQTKTLFTALFSVLMLGRRLVPSQWAALFLLFGGTVLATDLSGSGGGRERSTESAALGLSAVIIAALLSASSSVYFEMVLKQESLPDSYASSGDLALWTRNIQLGSFALPLSLLAAALQDGRHIMRVGPLQVHAKRRVQALLTGRSERARTRARTSRRMPACLGLLPTGCRLPLPAQGFNDIVWLVVIVNGLGGLLVAATMKYADNIVKCFATALAIISGTLLSVPIFGFVLSQVCFAHTPSAPTPCPMAPTPRPLPAPHLLRRPLPPSAPLSSTLCSLELP